MAVARLAPETAAFYTAQSAFTDPGDLAAHYTAMPADPAALARAVRELMLHRLDGELFGHEIADERMRDDAETRYTDDILRLILDRDPAPLDRPRAYGDRFVGVCRDFALLHTSLLRHAGIPARLRAGFADYFGPDGFHCDHTVTEYWDARRGAWLLADAELADPALTARFAADFDPMDVPRDRFLVAGKAWRRIRAGDADPRCFGVAAGGPLTGAWFAAGNVRLDLANLNKAETLLWDIWGLGADNDADLGEEIRAVYDEAALVTGDEVPFAAARALFTGHEGLRTPATVLSLAPFNGPREVALR